MYWRERMLRAISYWLVLILSGLVAFFTFLLLPISLIPDSEHETLRRLSDVIPLVTLFLTSLTTFSAILLGWRLDRRQAKELELKTKDLELKIKELELKLASNQMSNTQPPPQQFPNF
jgi:hypothetical protein